MQYNPISEFFVFVVFKTKEYAEEITGITVCSSSVTLFAPLAETLIEKAITGCISMIFSVGSAYLIHKLKQLWGRKKKPKQKNEQ